MPLFWLSIAFLAGIVCSKGLTVPLAAWLSAACLMVLAAVFFRRWTAPPAWLYIDRLPLPFLLVAFSLGGARFVWANPAPDSTSLAWYNDRPAEVILEGMLVEPPSVRDNNVFLKFSVSSIHDGATSYQKIQPVKGLVRVSLREVTDLRYGDVLHMRGKLRSPPQIESFDYATYLAAQGVSSILQNPEITLIRRDAGSVFWTFLYAGKSRLLSATYKILPDPEASLMAGILLGEDNNIPPALVKAFQDTGTSHVIAISGFNIGIVAGLFSSLFGRLLGRRRGFWASILGIALYTILVGAGASVVRAAIMGGLALFARQIGRRQDGLNTLTFTAALMALWNPYLPWDASFQLSFAATLGLILYAQPFSDAFGRIVSRFLPASFYNRISQLVSEYVLFTLAAQLTTLPLILYHFQRLSLSSLLVNPLILPAQPPIMILGGAAVLSGATSLPLGKILSILVYPFLLYTIRMVEGFASFSGTVFSIENFPLSSALIFYALLLGVTFIPPLTGEIRRWISPALCSVGICLISVAVWQTAFRAPDGRLSLTALDTGGGRAILLQSPSGRTVLIGGGARPSLLSAALGRRLPFLNHHMDYWLPLGSQAEQIKALQPLIERYPPQTVLWLGNDGASTAAQTLSQSIQAANIPFHEAEDNQTLDLGDGTRLSIYQKDNQSCGVRVTYGSFQAVLVSGSGLPRAIQGTTALSTTALLFLDKLSEKESAAWVQTFHPLVAIISKPEILASPRIEFSPSNVLPFPQGNWIKFTSDGTHLWAEEGKE